MAPLFLLSVILLLGKVASFPANELVYSIERDQLVQEEQSYPSNRLTLSEDEKTVNLYLGYLKQVEFNRTRPAILPSRPIEEVLDNVTRSDLFRALWSMPKGGNMHVHEPHLVSKRTLLDIVFASEDFPYLFVKNISQPDAWKLDFFVNPPANQGWVNVSNSTYYTKERILQHQTFMSILDENARRYPTDTNMRWRQMDPLWTRGSDQLINNINIKRKYVLEMLNSSLAEGVQYLETRREIDGKLYELDHDPQYNTTNGKKYIDNTDGEVELNLTISIVQDFIKSNPSFIGIRFIIYSTRWSPKAKIRSDIDRVLRVHGKYPDWVVGYDLVAEEDAGRSHIYFSKELVSLYNPQTDKPRIDLYMHTAETNFPVDLKMSRHPSDPTSAAQNTYDAVALGSKRVGHGLGFSKQPYLMTKLKEKNVAMEVCPVSNQLLAFTPDIRNHPAVDYIRFGLPVVFGSDDPGTFGYDYFTVDWYMAYMAWGIDLADLKLIANNAINYSSMDNTAKTPAMAKLTTAWDAYITKMKSEACGKTYTETPLFHKVFPSEGAKAATTKVYIFGDNFQRGICNTIKCKFGNTESANTELRSTQLVVCESPSVSTELTVEVSITFDGTNYLNTGHNFTYMHTVPTTPVPSPTSGKAVCIKFQSVTIASFSLLSLLITKYLW